LVVDQYAADIVRDIFKWKLEGVSPQDIADALNKLGVLSPMEYKRSLEMKFTTSFKTNAKAVWSAGTVIRILKNPIYTGVLVQGKETTPSYKVHKRITKDESEWTVINDSHEAIISKLILKAFKRCSNAIPAVVPKTKQSGFSAECFSVVIAVQVWFARPCLHAKRNMYITSAPHTSRTRAVRPTV